MEKTHTGEKIQIETLEYKPRKFRNTTAWYKILFETKRI